MNRMKRMTAAYRKIVSGYGFSILAVLCIGIITATSVWTKRDKIAYIPPDITPSDEMTAAVVQQDSLPIPRVTPVPAQKTVSWTAPLENVKVVRSYSPDALMNYGGLWQTHDGVDLETDAGESVAAISNGQVLDCGSDPLFGAWVEIDFGQGWMARYSGLSVLSAIGKGDRVSAGQTIGFSSEHGIYGADTGSSVHLSVYQDGLPVDPLTLFEN